MARQSPQTPRRQQQQQQQQLALSASASAKSAPRSQAAATADPVLSDPNDSCREDDHRAHKSGKQQTRSPSTRTLTDNASNDAESIEDPEDSSQERSGGGRN
ncbi:hypothetical protein LPJ56_003827, partial [Coemansia sp. RSA 2599]